MARVIDSLKCHKRTDTTSMSWLKRMGEMVSNDVL